MSGYGRERRRAQRRTEQGALAERYVADELVVALPHLRLILAELDRLGTPPLEQEEDAALGLALLRVDPAAAATRLAQAAASPVPSQAAPRDGRSALDELLSRLRGHFGRRYGGWTPTLGKNRVVGRVVARYDIGGGGENAPTAALAPLTPRDTEPGRGVRVGVLDTRLSPHPLLAGGYVAGLSDLLAPDELLDPDHWWAGHATFVTGLVLQQAPGAVVHLSAGLDADATADSWTVARQIAGLRERGLDVLNLSFGCYTDDGQPPLVLTAALERLGPEVVVVAAAGNDGSGDAARPELPNWPAAYEDVLAVGAVDAEHRLPSWSAAGPWVDVVAPGVDVQSTYLPIPLEPATGAPSLTGVARWSGTSFAAATAAGAIAAATQRGRRSARDALDHLLRAAPRDGENRPILGVPGGDGRDVRPDAFTAAR